MHLTRYIVPYAVLGAKCRLRRCPPPPGRKRSSRLTIPAHGWQEPRRSKPPLDTHVVVNQLRQIAPADTTGFRVGCGTRYSLSPGGPCARPCRRARSDSRNRRGCSCKRYRTCRSLLRKFLELWVLSREANPMAANGASTILRANWAYRARHCTSDSYSTSGSRPCNTSPAGASRLGRGCYANRAA